MPSLRYVLARSDAPVIRFARRTAKAIINTPVPAPRLLFLPLVRGWAATQSVYYFLKRKLIVEPFFKVQCASYGHGVRCGNFVHWISGSGDIVLGDGVYFDGKADIMFAAVLPERPRLEVGSRTYINHRCAISVAKRVSIGDDVYIAGNVRLMDSPGHPLDPAARLAKLPPMVDQIREIVIGDNVWLGTDVMVLPGVTIGEGSVVAAGAVVTQDVPPYTLAGGIPARPLRALSRPNGAVASDHEMTAAVAAR